MEGISVFGSIYKTYEYDMFKFIKGNRKLNVANVNKLERSMKEEQLIIPIAVNENYEIIDGQHRLSCCKKLRLPVYYYILNGYSQEQMKRANLISTNWNKDDFLNAYVIQELNDYITFYDIKECYGIRTTDLIKIISRVKKVSTVSLNLDFEKGRLSIDEEEKEEILEFLFSLEDFSGFSDYKRSKFISAFLNLYYYKKYEHKVMQTKLLTNSVSLIQQSTKEEYISLLCKIYCKRNRQGNSIYYDIKTKKFYTTELD
ncbi:ParB/RepB/Spo0J family partition protein [Clostridium perfringens]|uniref:ParB/RepB/Spo0J family partition protein n=1 Tax=Clostridium perfringens TaxID=1502 RepID=UPI001A27783B|nr:ParB/RepB/Spo0J family partition protein [Clostridium perfringens]EIF6158369.1 ParB-like nuclease domain-containing protein [Clostridium perfringens]EJT6478259.1 ParB-like nuclease domain-containing protein [Clostridium perfringens]MDK0563084.1 ParB/RepB/Spo0J family partition protein [Clostridium perfringens]MDK0662910.1 ParB/RepB/Spo0J family partition protein [Clostridium perfringens]MDM0516877.1 ParB/RepB/Spo0J family partition protein [Clostridium perfringens]